MIVENYTESWDSELQHSMVGNLWINYQNLCYIFQIQCLQPHLETLFLDDCSPCSCSALPQHLPSSLTGTVYLRYSRLTLLFTQVFALKVTLEELFYTVVSNIPPASLLFALYLHVCGVCMCVCVFVQTPIKSLDGKRTLVTIIMFLAHNRLPGMC